MTCSSSGDPHVRMFSGDTGHPQRRGPYVFAQNLDKSFVVQVCHRPVSGTVSINSMVAVKTAEGIYKYKGGAWHKPAGASLFVAPLVILALKRAYRATQWDMDAI